MFWVEKYYFLNNKFISLYFKQVYNIFIFIYFVNAQKYEINTF